MSTPTVPTEGERQRGALEDRLPIRDYQCATCGYGVSVRDVPDSCPMCRSSVWEPTVWQPFSRLARASDDRESETT
jgi:hypothetical protein